VFTRLNDPLVASEPPASSPLSCNARPLGSRVQLMYLPADLGIAAAVTGISWGPDSNALFAASHPNIILELGHSSSNQLSQEFDQNFNVGVPQQVYSGEYDVPQALNINPPNFTDGFWPWPKFDSAFEYDGMNNLVFEQVVEPANNCQILRIAFDPGIGLLSNRHAFSGDSRAATAQFVQPAGVISVNDITPDGSIIVGQAANGAGAFYWRWQEDPAPTLIGGLSAVAVSEDGSVIAGNIDDPVSGKKVADFSNVPVTLPRTPHGGDNDRGQHQEWVAAVKANKPEMALANFEYAGPMTEAVLLGNVAMRTGKPVQWDPKAMKVTNNPDANQYIRGYYRQDDLARVYAAIGDEDRAIELFRELLSTPGYLTRPLLRADPMLAELRQNPRFMELLDQE